MEISTALESFHDFLFILFLIGLVVFVALYFVDAGYGKMRTEKWGPAILAHTNLCQRVINSVADFRTCHA